MGWIFEPIARVVITALALAAGLGLTGSFAALLIGSWSAAVLAVISLTRRVRVTPRQVTRIDVREIVTFSSLSWGTTLTSTGLIWADTLLIGALVDSEAVGIYTIATRLVTLAVFVMAPINALFAPHFAHLHARNDHAGLTATYAAATNWILRLSLPAFIVLAVFPETLLAAFGPGFSTGATGDGGVWRWDSLLTPRQVRAGRC